MKKLILVGSTAALITGAGATQAKTEVVIEKASSEIIQICEKEVGPDTGEFPFAICLKEQSELFKDCWDNYPKDYASRKRECTDPISDRSETMRWEVMYDRVTHIAETNAPAARIKKDEELMFSDKKMLAFTRGAMTRDNADKVRRNLCAVRAQSHGHASQKIFDLCNRVFNKPTYALDFSKQAKWQAGIQLISSKQKTLPDSHKACLDAKDYEGCMRVQSGQARSPQSMPKDNCKPNKWCIASTGTDPLGKQKIEGWMMLYRPSLRSVLYRRPSAQKVNVRGKTDRYFQIETLLRHVVDPVSAVTPTSSVIGSARTNCTSGYGGTVNCTTTPPLTINTPGRAGSPGGIADSSAIYILDCKERTVGWHLNGQLKGKWRKPSSDETRKLEKYCPIITTLETSTFDTYSKK